VGGDESSAAGNSCRAGGGEFYHALQLRLVVRMIAVCGESMDAFRIDSSSGGGLCTVGIRRGWAHWPRINFIRLFGRSSVLFVGIAVGDCAGAVDSGSEVGTRIEV
jgi:hypothetical protein